MLSEARRPLFGRVALGALVTGAALSLSACGLPLLPPAFQDAAEPSPSPVTLEETESEEPDPSESQEPEPFETEEPEGLGPEDQDVVILSAGDCINEWTADFDDTVSTVPKIDCEEPHDLEVYHEAVLDEAGDYPGDEAVGELVHEECAEAFEPFVGAPWEESALDISILYPTEDSWNSGDFGYLCLVGQVDSQTSGTLEGFDR